MCSFVALIAVDEPIARVHLIVQSHTPLLTIIHSFLAHDFPGFQSRVHQENVRYTLTPSISFSNPAALFRIINLHLFVIQASPAVACHSSAHRPRGHWTAHRDSRTQALRCSRAARRETLMPPTPSLHPATILDIWTLACIHLPQPPFPSHYHQPSKSPLGSTLA